MRSIWKGYIRFSLVSIPVKVYNAVDSAQSIKFNQLHKGCNGNIGYDKRCKKCNQLTPNEEIVKGYQYEPDQYVIIEAEDLQKLKLKSTKIIELEGFVDASEIHPTWYEAPYYAGPDGLVAAKAYSLLHEALRESAKVGIGKVVLREREDVVILAPHEGGIVLYKLRYPNEVRKMKDVPELEGLKDVDREQLKLAHSLVETMSTTVSNIEMKDGYLEALRDLITSKVEGKEIVTVAEEERPVVDIMTALKQSIEQAKAQRKPMVKAPSKPKPAKAEPAVSEIKPARGGKRKVM